MSDKIWVESEIQEELYFLQLLNGYLAILVNLFSRFVVQGNNIKPYDNITFIRFDFVLILNYEEVVIEKHNNGFCLFVNPATMLQYHMRFCSVRMSLLLVHCGRRMLTHLCLENALLRFENGILIYFHTLEVWWKYTSYSLGKRMYFNDLVVSLWKMVKVENKSRWRTSFLSLSSVYYCLSNLDDLVISLLNTHSGVGLVKQLGDSIRYLRIDICCLLGMEMMDIYSFTIFDQVILWWTWLSLCIRVKKGVQKQPLVCYGVWYIPYIRGRDYTQTLDAGLLKDFRFEKMKWFPATDG